MDGMNRAVLMNGADIILDHLTKQKVPYLFGLCGHGITGFMDAAFKAQNRIRTISTHHEQTAGRMADAYYKVRGEPVRPSPPAARARPTSSSRWRRR